MDENSEIVVLEKDETALVFRTGEKLGVVDIISAHLDDGDATAYLLALFTLDLLNKAPAEEHREFLKRITEFVSNYTQELPPEYCMQPPIQENISGKTKNNNRTKGKGRSVGDKSRRKS